VADTGLDLSNYFPYLINRVGMALVERFTKDALQTPNLSIGLWRVLAVTANNDGIRQVDLVRLTSIEVSTVSRLVTRLMELGLIARSRSMKSNREVIVKLTPKGKALFQELSPFAFELQKTATRGIARTDLTTAKRVLSQMYENLQPR
jgi:MarR family transcriptional regulator, organic hydroperoxide resistance regulator